MPNLRSPLDPQEWIHKERVPTAQPREKGSNRVFIVASHAVLCGDAVEKLDNCPAESVLYTDTIPSKSVVPQRAVIASVAPLLARAIDRIHRSESVSSLFDDNVRERVEK